jgi:hypothetical protein
MKGNREHSRDVRVAAELLPRSWRTWEIQPDKDEVGGSNPPTVIQVKQPWPDRLGAIRTVACGMVPQTDKSWLSGRSPALQLSSHSGGLVRSCVSSDRVILRYGVVGSLDDPPSRSTRATGAPIDLAEMNGDTTVRKSTTCRRGGE